MPRPEAIYGPQRSILITGASSGIGAALAEELAPYGGSLALVARRQAELAQVAERVTARGGHPLPLTADVTDLEAVRRVHQQLVAKQGPVQVAFLNAGIGRPVLLRRFSAERVREHLEVNLIGVCTWLEVLLPGMLERQEGIIAATSSLARIIGVPGQAGYSTSKAALSRLMEILRGEAKGCGIQLTTIEPGFVRTPMTAANKFHMPWLVEADEAARIITRQVAAGQRLVQFPAPMVAALHALRHVPLGLYDAFTARLSRRQKS